MSPYRVAQRPADDYPRGWDEHDRDTFERLREIATQLEGPHHNSPVLLAHAAVLYLELVHRTVNRLETRAEKMDAKLDTILQMLRGVDVDAP